MFQVKTIEIRDSATFIPAIAVKLEHVMEHPDLMGLVGDKIAESRERDRYLMSRAGFGKQSEDHEKFVILIPLTDYQAQYDPFQWMNRTRKIAHLYLIEHWDSVPSGGGIVDVQFILGETKEPKRSERLTT